jgi:hypothetical protein
MRDPTEWRVHLISRRNFGDKDEVEWDDWNNILESQGCIPLSRLVREVKLLGLLSRSIRTIERTLVKKTIILIDRKLRDQSLSLINLSLKFCYCSMMLSNHVVIRLISLVSKIKVEVVKWVCN